MNIYMQVTNDQYELPLVVADSIGELARMTGHSKNTVASAISHGKKWKRGRSQWLKVTIEED